MTSFLNALGDRNPQLLRELKSRLKSRGVATALILSLIAQLLLLAFFRAGLESSPWRYCMDQTADMYSSCMADGKILWDSIDWSRWWLEIFIVMNWAIPILLTGLGMYFLIGDIQQEEQRGTMNFIRLSPRRSQNIFLGKLLGVPILIYFGIALAIPLHLIAAIGAVSPIGFVASYYGLLLLDTLLFFAGAIAIGMLAPKAAKAQGQSRLTGGTTLAVPLLSVLTLLPQHLFMRRYTVWHPYRKYMYGSTWNDDTWQWFGLALGKSPLAAHGVQFLAIGLLGFWIWQMLHRAYQRPSATPLSKLDCYGIALSLTLFLLGFFSPLKTLSYETAGLGFLLLILQMWLLFILFLWMLLPSRQTLLDWLHTRRMQQPNQRSPLFLEWLVGEQSPGVLALGLTLCIMAALGAIWLAFLPTPTESYQQSAASVGLWIIVTILMMSIYGLLAQSILFLKTPKRMSWAMGSVALAMLLPLLSGAILALGNPSAEIAKLCFLFSPLPWPVLLENSSSGAPIEMILGAIATQVLLIVGLSVQFVRQLHSIVDEPPARNS